nr:ADYC domain-containing protein [Pyxidicoccus fallax]
MQPAFAGPPASDAQRYARRCLGHSLERGVRPDATLLWGTKRSWSSTRRTDERRSVLVSVDNDAVLKTDLGVKAVRLEQGRLVAWPDASSSLVGTVLQGNSSDGKPVEVAICGSEPAPENSSLHRYRIEAWNPVAREWENPCAATSVIPNPRVLAVQGVWDSSGARHDIPGKLTLACEGGAIGQCIRWGYKPWEQRDGQSLAGLHQTCTRMVRADYCGNGLSHTQEHTLIDMYDALGVLSLTTESSSFWNTERASFEAAWGPEGADCLARTRDGRALTVILHECPGRFHPGDVDLSDGDRCTVHRQGLRPDRVLLRNRSYASNEYTDSL